ncbi:hypothetical protein D9619_005255 [Psilocybe cf. subviscida]|uniref:Uncharacterized protein n=1 Tax=Psilocybe cf. subviscida TaxID=2480587 RepID=A0A8H5FBC1_9AGAR|nr:hypothetical protein D9619_005255 [Psilocybe cf. subviscida]
MVPLFRIPESVLHNMRSRCTSFVPLSLLLAPYIQLVNAVAKNYTIGDTIGDHRTGQKVLYQPRKLWGTQACQNCSILPDVARIGAGTYHEATSVQDPSQLNITMNFSGTAIYAFFTLVDNQALFPQVTTLTSVDFFLDGNPLQPPFQYVPTEQHKFVYQHPVLVKDGLDNRDHTLVISGFPKGGPPIYINFDYALYTHDDLDDTQSASSTPSTVISPTSVPSDTSPSYMNTSGSNMTVTKYSTVAPAAADITTVTVLSSFPMSSAPSQGTPAPASAGLVSSKISTRANAGTIAGTVIGVLVFLGALIPLTCYFWRQRKFRKHKEGQKEAVRFYREKLVRRVYPLQ